MHVRVLLSVIVSILNMSTPHLSEFYKIWKEYQNVTFYKSEIIGSLVLRLFFVLLGNRYKLSMRSWLSSALVVLFPPTYGCQLSLMFQCWLHSVLWKCCPTKTVGVAKRLLDSWYLGQRSGGSCRALNTLTGPAGCELLVQSQVVDVHLLLLV